MVIIPTSPDTLIRYVYETETDSRTPPDIARVTLIELRVNGKSELDAMKEETYIDEFGRKGLRQKYEIELRGQPEYRVKRVMLRKIAIDRDPVLDYRSQNFINGPTSLKVLVRDPNLKVYAIGNVSEEFVDHAAQRKDQGRWHIDFEYEGFMFPNQGYMLFMQRQVSAGVAG